VRAVHAVLLGFLWGVGRRTGAASVTGKPTVVAVVVTPFQAVSAYLTVALALAYQLY